MKTLALNTLLLKTAFSCMVCDGNIDDREIALIKKLQADNQLFGKIDIDVSLKHLLVMAQENVSGFLKSYFKELSSLSLTETEQLKLIEVAIATLKADEKIEYKEIKFFKLIRSKLSVKNETILLQHPDFEDYVEADIFSEAYLSQFFDIESIVIDKDFLKSS